MVSLSILIFSIVQESRYRGLGIISINERIILFNFSFHSIKKMKYSDVAYVRHSFFLQDSLQVSRIWQRYWEACIEFVNKKGQKGIIPYYCLFERRPGSLEQEENLKNIDDFVIFLKRIENDHNVKIDSKIYEEINRYLQLFKTKDKEVIYDIERYWRKKGVKPEDSEPFKVFVD